MFDCVLPGCKPCIVWNMSREDSRQVRTFPNRNQVLVGRIVLACVWMPHIIYFSFGVKTLKEND